MLINSRKTASPYSQQGIGLIEVMVALMLLAIAVLGFSAMQMTAVKATDESLMRTRALTVIRGGAETMRANPAGIATFKKAITDPATSATVDGKSITHSSCLIGGTPATCTANQLAARDALVIKKHGVDNDMKVGMVACPGTSGAQERQCFVTSWGTTKPLLNDGDATACAKADGTYKTGAQCFIMEAY